MTIRSLTSAAAVLLLAAAAIAACAGPQSTSRVHPEEVKGAPICSSCHDTGGQANDHDAAWMTSHGRAAVNDRRVCDLCHRASTCADCHGDKEEIKPSDKRGSRFDPAMPHRGDYLSQHRVDGRLDPASCFPCHGRKNDRRCTTCHK
ncbi:MAG TPA: cytochrome C [bacterium]